MSVLNQCCDEPAECPLCMEPLEVDDLNFFPCTCGYQICRFCWHRIRTDENGLCPACRKPYPENPADFKPLSSAELQKLKVEKRQKDQQRKQKVTESRQHLAAVRVVQRNLVFVVGLPPRLAEPDTLKRHEYFGKFGKILKVVINPSNSYAGVQGPSASAYVTYIKREDALRAIAAVNNISVDGRLLKASLGTTKYCSNFLKNQPCPKPECMYLHELGDQEASFTKDDMTQGKHQEYERKLHEQLNNQTKEMSANVISMNNIISSNNNNEEVKESWPAMQDDQEASSSASSSPAPPSEAPKSRQKSDYQSEKKTRNTDGILANGSKPGSKEVSPVHQQAPSPSSSTSSLSGGPSPSTIQQSQSLSSSSSSISEDVLQPNASETHDALENLSKYVPDNGFYWKPSPVEFGSQKAVGQNTQPQVEAMQENLMPLLDSFNWQTALGYSKPEENTNSSVSKDIEDELGFDPFAETQKALEELIKTEQQQQQQHQQHMLRQQQLQYQHYQQPQTSHQRPMVPSPVGVPGAPPGFFQPFKNCTNAPTGSKILPFLRSAPTGNMGNGLAGKEVKDSSSFNLAQWRNILPNIGASSPPYNNGMPHQHPQHPMQAQHRDWQNDWTAMDPAIVAASASPRMAVDNGWNKHMDQNSIYHHANGSYGNWPRVVPNAAPTTAPPPGFSHPMRMASRGDGGRTEILDSGYHDSKRMSQMSNDSIESMMLHLVEENKPREAAITEVLSLAQEPTGDDDGPKEQPESEKGEPEKVEPEAQGEEQRSEEERSDQQQQQASVEAGDPDEAVPETTEPDAVPEAPVEASAPPEPEESPEETPETAPEPTAEETAEATSDETSDSTAEAVSVDQTAAAEDGSSELHFEMSAEDVEMLQAQLRELSAPTPAPPVDQEPTTQAEEEPTTEVSEAAKEEEEVPPLDETVAAPEEETPETSTVGVEEKMEEAQPEESMEKSETVEKKEESDEPKEV